MSWLSTIFKAPLLLLVVASFVASGYAAYNKIQGIGWGTPVIIGIILILYLIGWIMETGGMPEIP